VGAIFALQADFVGLC